MELIEIVEQFADHLGMDLNTYGDLEQLGKVRAHRVRLSRQPPLSRADLQLLETHYATEMLPLADAQQRIVAGIEWVSAALLKAAIQLPPTDRALLLRGESRKLAQIQAKASLAAEILDAVAELSRQLSASEIDTGSVSTTRAPKPGKDGADSVVEGDGSRGGQ